MRFALLLLLFAARLPAGSFHFAIVSDRTGRAMPGVYEQVWREVAAAHPDFVVTVGDAIEGLTSASEARAQWEALRPLWPHDVPVYHAPGNHDIWDPASEALFAKETGREPFYSFDFQDAHFVVLDNSRTENLSPAQMRFLEADLAKQSHPGPKFVLFHRPFWLIPLKLGENGFVLQSVAKRYGVCCVLSGHGHQLQSVTKDGVLYLELGSSGASLAGAGPAGIGYSDGWFYQYGFVTVNGADVTFEIRELGAPFGEGRRQQFHAKAR